MISSRSVGGEKKEKKQGKKEEILRLVFKGFICLNLLHKSGRISVNNGPIFNPKKVLEYAGR